MANMDTRPKKILRDRPGIRPTGTTIQRTKQSKPDEDQSKPGKHKIFQHDAKPLSETVERALIEKTKRGRPMNIDEPTQKHMTGSSYPECLPGQPTKHHRTGLTTHYMDGGMKNTHIQTLNRIWSDSYAY